MLSVEKKKGKRFQVKMKFWSRFTLPPSLFFYFSLYCLFLMSNNFTQPLLKTDNIDTSSPAANGQIDRNQNKCGIVAVALGFVSENVTLLQGENAGKQR